MPLRYERDHSFTRQLHLLGRKVPVSEFSSSMAFAACPSHGPGVKMLRDWPIAKLIGKLRWYLGDVDDPAMTHALRQWCVWISIYPLSLCPMLGNSLCPAQAGSIWIRWGTCVSPETWRWGSWWIGTFWTWDGHSDFEATDFQRKDLRYFKIMFFLGQDSRGRGLRRLGMPIGPKARWKLGGCLAWESGYPMRCDAFHAHSTSQISMLEAWLSVAGMLCR